MLRAAQSYITLVESLGMRKVLPEAFKEGLAYVASERPEYTQETENTMSANRALEIVTKWLERVATRDPQLFKIFISKIRTAESTQKTKPKPKVSKVEKKDSEKS